jgi:hypothetical protein
MMQFMDGFDYLTAANLGLKWDASVGFALVTPGVYGKGSAVSASNNAMVHTLNTNTASGNSAFHFNTPALNTVITIASWRDGGTTQVDLRMSGGGDLYFTRNGTSIGTVIPPALRITAGIYYWLEAQIIVHQTLGQLKLYIGSSLALSLTGLNTQNTANQYFNQVTIQGNNSPTLYDNYHFWDPSAGDVSAFPYGEHIIDTKLANAVGSNTTWNKGGSTINANNYQQVNEANEDGDTTYVFMSASGAGDIDSYGWATLSESTGTIGTIAINTIARIDDAGPHTYDHYTLSGGSSALSSAITPLSSYDNEQTFQGTDPNTGVAWTIAGRNAAQFGYKLIS